MRGNSVADSGYIYLYEAMAVEVYELAVREDSNSLTQLCLILMILILILTQTVSGHCQYHPVVFC